MPNPYDPGNPAKPEYFGGRHPILRIVDEKLRSAKTQAQSGGILLYGYRGVGKTSIIKKIISIAGSSGSEPTNTIIIERRLSRTTSDQELYQILNEELLEAIGYRKNIIQRMAGQIQSAKLFEIEVDFNTEQKARTPFQQWKYYIRSIKNADCLLIALDDADYLSPEALGELKTILEDSSKIPILLVISGGVQFEERLVDDYSPIARIFSGASFNLGKFSIEETKEVLEKPLTSESTKWEDTAIAELQKLTIGYPYLVQCLAKASYVEGGTITVSKVTNSVRDATDIGKSWLDHEIPGASDQDVISFAKLVSANKEVIKSSEMSKLGIVSAYIGRLVKFGILKQISRGRYVVQKSPIIAVYEMLKRDLKF